MSSASARRAAARLSNRCIAEIAVELGPSEVPGRLPARLQVAPAKLRRVILGHREAEGIAAGFLVLGEDVRRAKSIAPDLSSIRKRARPLQRRTDRDEQDGYGERCLTHERSSVIATRTSGPAGSRASAA